MRDQLHLDLCSMALADSLSVGKDVTEEVRQDGHPR